jgi:hypothetical protein
MRDNVGVAALTLVALSLMGCTAGASEEAVAERPVGEIAQGMVSMSVCLDDRGWVVSDPLTGEVNVPEEQADRFQEDFMECAEQLTPEEAIPLTDAEIERLYLLEVDTTRCLNRLGYALEAPSLQVFLDRYKSGRPYIAHAELGAISQAESVTISEACPPATLRFERDEEP